MQNILIVEDSRLICSVAKEKIETELEYKVCTANTFSEAKELLENSGKKFFLCLVGLYLSDAPYGEIVDYMISMDLPTIVFTGTVSEEIREEIWGKRVVDYVTKEADHNLDYIIYLIKRINKNRRIKVLVVDDSESSLATITDLLEVHRYQVLSAVDGHEALETIENNPDIKIVIIDYYMPNMDGLQLVREIRKNFSKEKLAIIGTSGNNLLSAKFIKSGANDFMNKNFFAEEFYCRINQNIEIIELLDEIRMTSNTDSLTGLYNRRYFYEVGNKLYENAMRENISITISMIDVDFFKKVNDKYGHAAGDQVLKELAGTFCKRFRSTDIVARLGGEEFCVLCINMKEEAVTRIFEELRLSIEKKEIEYADNTIQVTVSIGVSTELRENLEEMVKKADDMLYRAKKEGRNRLVVE